jgi:hypothetical protein
MTVSERPPACWRAGRAWQARARAPGRQPAGRARAVADRAAGARVQAGAITGFLAAFTEGPIDFYKSQIQYQIIRAKSDPSYKRAPRARSRTRDPTLRMVHSCPSARAVVQAANRWNRLPGHVMRPGQPLTHAPSAIYGGKFERNAACSDKAYWLACMAHGKLAAHSVGS